MKLRQLQPIVSDDLNILPEVGQEELSLRSFLINVGWDPSFLKPPLTFSVATTVSSTPSRLRIVVKTVVNRNVKTHGIVTNNSQ